MTGKTYISRDYLTDENLVHGHGPDTYVRIKGIHGVIATPLFGDQGPFGAITVWSTKEDAFGPEDASLLETIAGQSAVALGPRPADRGARPVARDARPAGRGGARAARDRVPPGRDGRRPGGHPQPDRQRDARGSWAGSGRGSTSSSRSSGSLLWTLPAGDAVQRPDRRGGGRGRRPGRAADRARGPRDPRGAAGRLGRLHARHAVPSLPRGRRGRRDGRPALDHRRARSSARKACWACSRPAHRARGRVRRGRAAAHRRARRARRRSPSPTPGSSTGSPRRRPRWGGPRTPSGRCARSPAG